MQTAKPICGYCQYNNGISGNEVNCGWRIGRGEPSQIDIPPYCAAQHLTSEGWENAAIKATERGDLKTANDHYQRAIETQTPVIL